MKSALLTLLLGICLIAAACARYNTKTGAMEISAPASNSRAAEIEGALATEQEQRIESDTELRSDLGKVEDAIRADMAESLELFASSPEDAQAFLAAALKEMQANAAIATAKADDRSREQVAVLTAIIEKNQTEGGSDDNTMMWMLGLLGAGGAAGGLGKAWGHTSEKSKNGKATV